MNEGIGRRTNSHSTSVSHDPRSNLNHLVIDMINHYEFYRSVKSSRTSQWVIELYSGNNSSASLSTIKAITIEQSQITRLFTPVQDVQG
ncbi:uncharacterized protein ASCRUDRAFT_8268 [Ascoidea rubescens DSM 1968]|uniref:Uncharacterized protein n=1 Tax=Ascoidea rubescens DSM 1968 TaxID=1344418 RepID=A0A1D2VGC2_9ASCO|nr:hypothetical protein ASCRUDRAFT_8268 [Ascoidea rubescens DSM 1968]ODV60649.1 hypothetical protein ASCRUDRAFT_8268 [Ascoidea rubescens DSM 1968]